MTSELVTKTADPVVMDVGRRDIAGRPAPVGFTMVPRDMKEMMEFAKLISASNFIPTGFRGKPGDVLVVMMQAAELEIPYFQALHNTAVINGRPTIWGDLVVALVQRSPQFEFLRRNWDEASKTATVVIKRKGRPEAVSRFSMEDAKRAKLANKDTYIQYPQRMCMWRAVSFAIRDEFADVLKGMSIAEEAMDAPPVVSIEPIRQPAPMAELVDGFLGAPPKEAPRSDEGPQDVAGDLPGEVVRITGAEVASEGKTAKGKPWTLYKITTEDGRALASFSSTIYETAFKAWEMGVEVRITTSPGKKPGQLNVETLEPVLESADEDEPEIE